MVKVQIFLLVLFYIGESETRDKNGQGQNGVTKVKPVRICGKK